MTATKPEKTELSEGGGGGVKKKKKCQSKPKKNKGGWDVWSEDIHFFLNRALGTEIDVWLEHVTSMTLVSLPHLNNLTNSYISLPIAKTIQEFKKFEYQTKD